MSYHSFDYDELTPKARFKLSKGSIIPRPIAWISSRNSDGSHNLAPFSHFNLASSSLLMVSFMRKPPADGDQDGLKDTARNVMREREGVVHIPDTALLKQLDLSSAELAVNESEISAAGLTPQPSSKISTFGIAEARIRFEVVLEKHLELMNDDATAVEADLMLLRIKAAHLRDDVFDAEKGYVLHEQLDPVARLGGPYYSGINALDYQRKYQGG